MPLRPCLEHPCPNLTRRTRCARHQTELDQVRNASREHYRGDYQQRAARLRAEANADPATTCALCPHGRIEGDPWTAHHIREGDPTSPLAAAHASCNYRHGDGSRQRAAETAGGT